MSLATIDKKYFILGYVSAQNRLYLINKGLNIVSYQLLTDIVEF